MANTKSKAISYQCRSPLEVPLRRLPDWYKKTHRRLPWRDTGDPYDVWLSEIMLQQTRVAAVIDYFQRFRRELPDVGHLADCDEERLLKLWEGLGYYSRVRNMQKAARKVMEAYHGQLPDSAAELRKLPGIGSYTAGAIASIAYGEAVPAVDGNVLRICSRISGNDEDIAMPQIRKALELLLFDLFQKLCTGEDAIHPGVLNQAMMELGATVCVPNGDPMCEACPVSEFCYARLARETDRLPVRSAKKPRRIERRTVLLIRNGDRWLIRKRPRSGLLAGLWELPSSEGHLSEEQALSEAEKLLGGGSYPVRGEALFIKKLQPAKHIFTHIEWHMEAYLIRIGETEDKNPDSASEGTRAAGGRLLFADAEEIETTYTLPSAFAAYKNEIYALR